MLSSNPYKLLEVSPNASAEEIKAAYLRLAKQWHPDRFSGAEKAAAEARFRALNEAYTAVKDPVRRSHVPPPAPAAPKAEAPPAAPQGRTAQDWYQDAKAAFEQNDPGKTLALVQYAIRQDARQSALFVLQGQALERLGEARKALKSFESALAINPKDAETLIRMADLYALEGLKARAEATLQAARRLAPNHRRFKAPKASAEAKGKGKSPAPAGSLADQAKALWGRLTGKG
ncbi:MAG TPA: DnaJ domain-containing protein [Holophagaceae bacterium]|nr:DnaJ domain-containing protein [Holophagaceae bacterium]